MGTGIINYDSPWGEIYDMACQAPWSPIPMQDKSALKRPPLSHAELEALSGMRIALIDETYIPSLPAYIRMKPNDKNYLVQVKAREACLRYMVEEAGLPARLFNFAGSANWAGYFCVPTYTTDATQLRVTGGDETDFSAPLHHRLDGPLIPNAGIIMTNERLYRGPDTILCAERRLDMAPQEFNTICMLHELFHLMQRAPLQPSAAFNVLRERDAENAALTAYQAVFGGAPVMAAGCIMSHMMGMLNSLPDYHYWPGLPLKNLAHGYQDVQLLQATAAYTAMNHPCPHPANLEAWIKGKPDEELTRFQQNYIASHTPLEIKRNFLLFLSDTEDSWADLYPASTCLAARRLLDAGRFACPELLNFDPVKAIFRPVRQSAGYQPTAA